MNAPRRVLVWTRGLEDAATDELLWANSDIEVVKLPCFTTHPISFEIPEGRFSLSVVTSRKAVSYALAHPELLDLLRDSSIYTFGAGTAAELRRQNLQVLQASQAKGSAELAKIVANTAAAGERILVLGPEEPSYDIVGYLQQQGHEARYLAIYQTQIELLLDEKTRLDLIANLDGVVCFASPSAVRGFVQAMDPANNRLYAALQAVAIGQTSLDVAAGHFAQCHQSPKQLMSSLWQTACTFIAPVEK